MMTSILFVDDEPNILAGLRRMLRSRRNEWRMEFVESGKEALERLAQATFDVVVSDMRMPEMDGTELLHEVSCRHPEVVRIILSGQSSSDASLKSVSAAHQFLSKPCDPDALIRTVRRACNLRSKLRDPKLKQLLTQMTTLPTVPAVYQQLIAELQCPDSTIDRVAEVISQDVGMTSKLLQLVNSSFFGLPRRIESPSHAACLLGINVLKSLVLSAGIVSQFDQSALADCGYSLDALIDHSVAVSQCAQAIAKDEQPANQKLSEDALLAGLVHDVGQLVLAANLPEVYKEILATANQNKMPLFSAEIAHLGASHAHLGGYLFDLWGLPEALVEAVTYHHDPASTEGTQFSLLTAVHVANALHNQVSSEQNVARLDMKYLGRLGILGRVNHWRTLVLQSSEKNQ